MLFPQAIHNMLCRLFHTGSKQPLQTVERANYAVFAIKMSPTPPSDLSKSEVQQKLKSGDLILSDPKSSKSAEEEELLLTVYVETY